MEQKTGRLNETECCPDLWLLMTTVKEGQTRAHMAQIVEKNWYRVLMTTLKSSTNWENSGQSREKAL